jgi:hypothetical protein
MAPFAESEVFSPDSGEAFAATAPEAPGIAAGFEASREPQPAIAAEIRRKSPFSPE